MPAVAVSGGSPAAGGSIGRTTAGGAAGGCWTPPGAGGCPAATAALAAAALHKTANRRMNADVSICLVANAQRVIDDLRELASRTSTPDGAQRLAWGPVWREARAWFREKVGSLGLSIEPDAAGNNWVTLPGASAACVLLGGHLDSVPNGGWLDGCLGVLTSLEALREFAATRPPVTLKLVDWADEEGARFGRSLLGSAAAAGSLQLDAVRGLTDRHG